MNPANLPDEIIPTRKSLLTRLKNWDDHAGWEDFFNTYWRLIYGVARRAGLNDTEAQEVVQLTVIAVAEKLKSGEFKYDPQQGSFKAWLLTHTQWRIKDQFRLRKMAAQRHHDPESGSELLESIPDATAEEGFNNLWETEWRNNLMQLALERVRPRVAARTFQIFQLHVRKDRPVEEVARRLGVSRAQVHLAKHRVAIMVRKELVKLGKSLG